MAGIEDIVVHPPHSVTWLVHINRSMWVGGVAGLMLQALHPLAMRGVWQNSTFQEDPFGRLRRTADFVGRITFGGPADADEIGRRVRGIHRALRVRDPETGRTHRVDDPELLLWVHCAEVFSYLTAARRGGLALTDRQADRYLAEQRHSATYVGLHAEEVPGSLAEMADYFAGMRSRLEVTPEAVSAVRFLLWPRLPAGLRALGPLKPFYLPFGALCYYTLPGWARRMYGLLPEVPSGAVSLALRAFRLGMNTLPEPVHDHAFMPATRDM
ncbi:oxygenase MpaB family protein, partial [Streptosporangium algeriense]